MTFEQTFLKDFEDWVNTQVLINEGAVKASQQVWEEDGDERAKDAAIRYESKLDAYRFLQTKFENYRSGKGFHDLPDNLLGKREY
ncbi:DUF1912 family protein [Streptococcus loxodontisalivarius]|uniref:DUF1912 family protein n=1 Tax=Streptococcus loxodontisalivarius TaxID=1349415 RepID=A0ABS2PRG7_9STRE|nr:DUF1912 family protein [Streptococcus loxodontisalivarius]MBM7642135.1 hypothetical protein [Streptococcus loxodontisalivarius]